MLEVIYDAERLAALSALRGAAERESAFEALLVINALYGEQVRLVNELAQHANTLPGRDDVALFWSWSEQWMRAARHEWEQRTDQQSHLLAQLERSAAERIGADRAQPRLDAIVRRASSSNDCVR